MWNCRLTQQWKRYRLYDVSQARTKQNNMSVILHVGGLGCQSTCLCWLTDHNKHVLQRQVMTENIGVLLKWEGRRHLEKLLSVVCHFCLIRWVERVSETKTHTSKNLLSSYSNNETFIRCCDGAQNRLRTVMEWFQNPPLLTKHTSVHWHTSTDSTQKMFMMNILTVFRLSSLSAALLLVSWLHP